MRVIFGPDEIRKVVAQFATVQRCCLKKGAPFWARLDYKLEWRSRKFEVRVEFKLSLLQTCAPVLSVVPGGRQIVEKRESSPFL